jgi:hypothetical protein
MPGRCPTGRSAGRHEHAAASRKRQCRPLNAVALDGQKRPVQHLKLLVVTAISWTVMAGGALWLFGIWPRTALAWVLVLGFGPIVFALATGLGDGLGETIAKLPGIRHADRAVERRTAHEALSATRIGYYLLRLLILLPPLVLVWWWFEGKTVALIPESVSE